jgi:hypothetical protein
LRQQNLLILYFRLLLRANERLKKRKNADNQCVETSTKNMRLVVRNKSFCCLFYRRRKRKNEGVLTMWNVKCKNAKGKWILPNRYKKRLAWKKDKNKCASVMAGESVVKPVVCRRQPGKDEPLAFCADCQEWTPMQWLPKAERGKKVEQWFLCEYCHGRKLTLRYLSCTA